MDRGAWQAREDSSLWTHWIHSFRVHPSYLGPHPVSWLFKLNSLSTIRGGRCGSWLLPVSPPLSPQAPQQSPWGRGIVFPFGSPHSHLKVWNSHFRPGYDFSCPPIWQEILHFTEPYSKCWPTWSHSILKASLFRSRTYFLLLWIGTDGQSIRIKNKVAGNKEDTAGMEGESHLEHKGCFLGFRRSSKG